MKKIKNHKRLNVLIFSLVGCRSRLQARSVNTLLFAQCPTCCCCYRIDLSDGRGNGREMLPRCFPQIVWARWCGSNRRAAAVFVSSIRVCVCQCVLRVDDVFFRSALQVALGSGSSRLCLSSFSSSAVQNEVLPRLSARLASSCFPISNNSRRLKRHCWIVVLFPFSR